MKPLIKIVDSTESIDRKLTNLLILVQSFQINWQRYYFSEGHISYQKHTKESALQLVDYWLDLSRDVPALLNTKAITLHSKNNPQYIPKVLDGIKTWATSHELYITFEGIYDIEHVNFIISTLLLCTTAFLVKKLRIEVAPALMTSSMDGTLHMNYVKWKSHVHWSAIDTMSIEYLELISTEDSIVVVADIRHSQDLITNSPSPEVFRDNLLNFLDGCKDIIKENYGIFDRVTGDGFICYFNKNLCLKFNKDYYSCMLIACEQILELAQKTFPIWMSQLRKVPVEDIGISIDIDSGIVHFSEKDDQLFAISEASVWATRMCSEGKAGQIVINNIPFDYLSKSGKSFVFNEIKCIAKNGEKFLAHTLEYIETINQNINENGDQDKES